jgi:hypothetical protein
VCCAVFSAGRLPGPGPRAPGRSRPYRLARCSGGSQVQARMAFKWKYSPKQSTILFMTFVMVIIVLYDKVKF